MRRNFIQLAILALTSLSICNLSFSRRPEVESATSQVSNWCLYRSIPMHVGYWTLYRPGIDPSVSGKRILLIVHGHNTTSLINAIASYVTKSLPESISKSAEENGVGRQKYYFGLGTLSHLARMITQSAKAPGQPNTPRYDMIVGYAYSSANSLTNIAAHAADQWKTFLAEAKSVDIIAHSMGGLVTRAVLEKHGLGEKYHNLITLSSPHQGIAISAKKHLNTEDNLSEIVSTADMITSSLDPNDPARSQFLATLNGDDSYKSPFYKTANYYAVAGDDYASFTSKTPLAFTPLKAAADNRGSIIQMGLNYMWGEKNALSDGLVPIYSALSPVLKRMSESFDHNPDHAVLIHANHRNVTGSIDNLSGNYKKNEVTAQATLRKILLNWINKWPYSE